MKSSRNNYLIIVVTYNAEHWVDTFIQESGGVPQYNFIVVDNASTDKTTDIISLKYPKVKLIKLNENLGFGRANNLGIEYGLNNGYEYFLLLNQDASISHSNVIKLIQFSKHTLDAGIVSPMQLANRNGDLEIGFAKYLTRKGNKEIGKIGGIEVSFVNAAIWLIPRNTLLKVGGFDPFYDHYGEDSDYVNRVVYHGLKVYVCSDSFGYHYRKQIKNRKKSSDIWLARYLVTILKNVRYNPIYAYMKMYYRSYQIITNKRKHSVSFIQVVTALRRVHNALPKVMKQRYMSSKTGHTYLNLGDVNK
ncbi:glycosyltransferase family 2 protein [Lewinella sp. IMCC34191]|uniref:glycosyltransferase family 2 protein n=1 Tax=Lewinella sp. IMCC34191 TaxID=2259172 RepID=UPI000E27F2B2|nr:glycosyltransferase family 2 protein [Lewinella sp. IMCC34191]